ncbi:peroxiredoxin [Hydromonas duriensis]|uniref:Thioredoxin peroxidase n=1 Tax=Hydromonas duriensis TaxID=1527608 RepID=A0A4R6YB21_9BURK|nr:peroxiredoxin C [Hydromonas duriensis]TDR32715.1 peroxiredoxin (alkyl hydroperoxide reductase subunit C) [Hydromonas duriensis]
MAVLVGKPAPDFTVAAVLGTGEIVNDYTFSKASSGKYAMVFFYPLDFTFVCPSELIALDHKMSEFTARGVEVVAVSVDSEFTHNAWRNTPINNGGIGAVKYTMAADIKREIQQAYDVESADGVAFRGAFIIDKNGIVRSQIVNDLPLGRSMDELLRIVDALQFTDEHGEVCPANWQKGDKGMTASPEGVAAYLSEHADKL